MYLKSCRSTLANIRHLAWQLQFWLLLYQVMLVCHHLLQIWSGQTGELDGNMIEATSPASIRFLRVALISIPAPRIYYFRSSILTGKEEVLETSTWPSPLCYLSPHPAYSNIPSRTREMPVKWVYRPTRPTVTRPWPGLHRPKSNCWDMAVLQIPKYQCHFGPRVQQSLTLRFSPFPSV